MTNPSRRTAAAQRGQLLKQLREEHAEGVAWAKAVLKEQKALRKQLCQPMREGPKTVPELAAATGLPAAEVLWHLMAMKKYDLIEEVGMCGEYYLYQRPEGEAA